MNKNNTQNTPNKTPNNSPFNSNQNSPMNSLQNSPACSDDSMVVNVLDQWRKYEGLKLENRTKNKKYACATTLFNEFTESPDKIFRSRSISNLTLDSLSSLDELVGINDFVNFNDRLNKK